MRTIIITTLIILICQILFAQKTEVYYGVSGRNDVVDDIIELYDNGYYIIGGFESGYQNYNGWNIKTDINLELIYDKVLEHELSTVAQFASVSDENGNIYVTGFTTYPSQWPFVTKLDSCGNKVWCKILDYSDEFEFGAARDIWLTKENEVIILTGFESESQIDKVHLICLSADGAVQWTKPYASRNDYSWIRNPSGYSIKEINNDYYISGYCYWPYPNDTTHFFLRPLFIGIDSLFNEKWILPFYALDSVYGDAFNTIAINDSVLMGVGMRRLEGPMENSLLMFFDIEGNELGYNQIPNEAIEPDISQNYILDIETINDSLFIAATSVGYNNTTFPSAEIIIDTSSNIFNYSYHIGTNGHNYLCKTFDNNFVFTTGIDENKGDDDIYVYKIDENLEDVPFDPTPHTYDSLCPGGIQSSTIDLTDCLVWTNIGDAPSPQEYYESIKQIPIKAYPNPVNGGEVTFEYENTEHHRNIELKCFDIYGELVHKEKVYRYQGESVVDVSSWKNGMYVAVVYSEGMPVGQCKFVIK
ncbi:MAG: T9SS type A sorting domain-containing protein [Bacteroidetes bacterium]|nr:T9SS type A sorting domain-containing protein [Bacteroidota bacterium]MBL7102926.1 T9SS type A sorting domain-containing protein [Bacteroidales bacterium]